MTQSPGSAEAKERFLKRKLASGELTATQLTAAAQQEQHAAPPALEHLRRVGTEVVRRVGTEVVRRVGTEVVRRVGTARRVGKGGGRTRREMA